MTTSEVYVCTVVTAALKITGWKTEGELNFIIHGLINFSNAVFQDKRMVKSVVLSYQRTGKLEIGMLQFDLIYHMEQSSMFIRYTRYWGEASMQGLMGIDLGKSDFWCSNGEQMG
ncbi:hypothetical protein QQP08_010843 [Theobroma cacao]|nr:hypothetical protein QQP08_010843 [Theobroma cacao]